MKLLFDQNLSYKLCPQLADIFPDSSQVRLLQLDQSHDKEVWDYAKTNGFLVVTQDSHDADMASFSAHPQKSFGFAAATNRPLKLKPCSASMPVKSTNWQKTTTPVA